MNAYREKKLFQVNIPARPNPKHHLYWEVEYSILKIYIMADSPEDATTRAWVLARVLNWEVSEGPFQFAEIADPLPEDAPKTIGVMQLVAKHNGVSLNFEHAPLAAEHPKAPKV